MEHQPVLLKEVVEWLRPPDPRLPIVDATVGLGGHAAALLEANPDAPLIGIDRDPRALEIAAKRLERFGSRVRLIEGRHEEIIDILEREGVAEAGAVLADLGVSSMQLDDAQRGFSFRFDAPLDMRMGREGATAADLVNTMAEVDLSRVLHEWGEEPFARRIARAIVTEREEVGPILTTGRLADVIRRVKQRRGDKIDPATLTFQALRIAVNGELTGLDSFVEAAIETLAVSGRIGIITFHSLEDRIVKRTLRALEGRCVCPPDLPLCGCGARGVVRIVAMRLEAGEEEISRNPRARSAKLRVAERMVEGGSGAAGGGGIKKQG
jgi:16S rRNA (cytosine1402-N4)-methyltransferase